MSVQSIECQLIQAQMKRYLAGVDFPDELLDQMERHLKACSECKAEANKQREALGGAPAEIAQAVVVAKEKRGLVERLKAKIVGEPPQAHTVPGLVSVPGKAPYPTSLFDAFKTPKNLVLSLSLAAVLVTMSTFMRQPSAFFGARASSVITEKPAAGDSTQSEATVEHTAVKDETSGHEDTGHGLATGPPPLSPDLRGEEPRHEDAPHATGPEGTTPDPNAEVASSGNNASGKPHKETVTHELDKVGGDLLIADSAAPLKKPATKATGRPADKPTTRSTAARPKVTAPRSSSGKASAHVSKPRARKVNRKAPRNVVRIYQP
ncbi:MAG: hypothetical protein JST30_04950 [Armatimonadetes bacterium]|nr:hypothetical protein [Armatimonadota bacterium]